MIRLLTATNAKYTKSAENLMRSAYKHGVDDCVYVSTDGMDYNMLKMFGDNVKEEARHWFYIWKPFLIWRQSLMMAEGDVLIYADAGQTITDSLKPLIDGMDQDILMFNNPWKHVEWCKADVMEAINYRDGIGGEPYTIRKQVQASLIFFRITPEVRNFVKEWMLYCLMPGFCDNSPSKIPNYPTFQEHRYDQAVLTCLQIKYGYKLHPFPSIENMDALYKVTDHHRKNNSQW
jgi:hypothetical protein